MTTAEILFLINCVIGIFSGLNGIAELVKKIFRAKKIKPPKA